MNTHRTKLKTSETSFRVMQSPRRGITLLFVISMIVLFLLMGTTFVVVSNDYLRGARRRNINGGVNAGAITREEGQRLVVQSFLEVIRGPSLDNQANPLRTHDLLGDMYGYGIGARLNPDPAPGFAPNVHASGHFLTFSIRLGPDVSGTFTLNATSLMRDPADNVLQSLLTHDNTLGTFPTIPPGHFNGRLITISSGDVKGLTCRVIQSDGTNPTTTLGQEIHTFVVYPLNPQSDLTDISDKLVEELSAGGLNNGTVEVVINGRPFAGTGAGSFDETSPSDAAALDPAYADEPNRQGIDRSVLETNYLARTPDGGTTFLPNDQSINEPWDAVDLQNVMLAGIVDDPSTGTVGTVDPTDVTPSFFRDSLARDDDFSPFTDGAAPPNRDTIVVDNDNDGVSDGIWIDTGLPIRSTPEGEYIKPLVSFLILDMDGRLNVNAHGVSGETATSASTTGLLQGGTGIFVPGLGLGPAEISLQAILPGTQAALINARYTSRRDTTDNLPGDEGKRDLKSLYLLAGYPATGTTGNHFFSELDLTGNYAVGFMSDGGATSLDALVPSMVPATLITNPITQSLTDSPYEVNLSGVGSSQDSLFVESQLERMLRPNDRDSILLDEELPDLLAGDIPSGDADSFLRKSLTTASFEVPSIPEDLNKRLFDVLESAVLAANGGTPLTQPEIDTIAATMSQLLSPEIRRGMPMNLNRIFGDGMDNNGNSVIDDLSEVEDWVTGLEPDDTSTTTVDESEVALDVDNNGATDVAFSGLFARHNFARRLFTLMVLITEYRNRDPGVDTPEVTLFDSAGVLDTDDFFDFNGDTLVTEADIWAHRKMLAQWCVNVVDFRDPDSVMTPFEVDLDPFDTGGWEVNGNPGTTGTGATEASGDESATLGNFGTLGAGFPNYLVLWGAERPELLITETSALHDVKLQDLASDSGPNAQVGPNTATDDDDFDSAFLPTASAFFELTNPWTVRTNVQTATAPREVYNAGRGGVDLRKRDVATDQSPVWRLVVVNPDIVNTTVRASPVTLTADDIRNISSFEDDIDTAIATDSAAVVRYVYFAEPLVTVVDPTAQLQFGGPKVYYPSTAEGFPTASSSILEPGQFAVVGSAGNRVSTSAFTTYFGRTTTDASSGPTASMPLAELNLTQQIVIDPIGGQVTWHPDGSSGSPFGDIAIAIDSNPVHGTRSLGISDPIDNQYQDIVTAAGATLQNVDDGVGLVDGAGMDFALDQPLDQQVVGATDWPTHPLNHRGLIPGYRVVCLQRLANPLANFSAATNPYRTVDSSAVDLFVFNGLMTTTDEDAGKAVNPGVSHQYTSLPDSLGTFERAESQTAPAAGTEALLWRTSVMGEIDAVTVAATAASPVVAFDFANTLGYVNDYFSTHVGTDTYPWLTWNNRPFANRFELANVPYTSSGWLTRLFSLPPSVTGGATDAFSAIDHAGAGLGGGTATDAMPFEDLTTAEQDKLKQVVHPNAFGFAHLLNFQADADESDRLAPIMDFVEVPSRFAGTFDYVDTDEFTSAMAGTWPARDDLDYSLTAPFDELPTARYAGKVNVNTIPSAAIWDSLLGARSATPGPYSDTTNGADFTELTTALDDNPLRPASAVNYTSGTPTGVSNTGLFRSATDGRVNGAMEASLLDYVPATQQAFNNTDRNAYFRNGIRQRLGSIATNRSSVFAIWVTVGYFEWNSETNDFRLDGGDPIEYGTESGTVERSRGFFLFDRSIPMAYEPGQDHNVERGILLQSLIE